MLHKVSRPFITLVEKYLPDSFIFVLFLTLITFLFAIFFTPYTPEEVLFSWGNGFWNLLSFSMQMLLVLITGYMLASTPLVNAVLSKLSSYGNTAPKAIILVTFISLLASWINWGFGLIVGALFAKEIAKRTKVDYRLLVASAYSGFLVWHGGLAGSIPLTIATEGHFLSKEIGVISADNSIFSGFNMSIVIGIFLLLPIINRYMLPKEEDSIYVDKDKIGSSVTSNKDTHISRPADVIEHSRILGITIGILGITFLIFYFFVSQGTLNLNSVIMCFLFMSILLHQTPYNLLNSLQQAIPSSSGIIIQFPFYAGIMAIMMNTGLAQKISEGLILFADKDSISVWSFLSAGIVNIFVPSGGGQWAIQGPIVIPAAQALGADITRVAMAVAWGDAWTNLIQPFWALPLLAIAGLKAKDIMGFCIIQLILTGGFIALMLYIYP